MIIKVLESIHSPNDLKKLNIKQLNQLCQEIRQQLVDSVLTTGGHLSSNLGVVELTVAMHYVFDQTDKLLWDVGHQSYVHKMLTGRYSQMHTLRQKDGLSGFTDPQESTYDHTISGHASTVISSAIGIAKARDIQGDSYNVVAVVGDGALTGGMTYEALNNMVDSQLLVIVNDNNMSIEKNVGKLSSKISKIRVGAYYKDKQRIKKILNKLPLIGKPMYKVLYWFKRRIKLAIINPQYFDNFDVKYIGVIDGNNLKQLIFYLTKIKNNFTNRPTVFHIYTRKGCGYQPAEEDQSFYHNYYPLQSDSVLCSQIVSESLLQLIAKDPKVCAISAAMKESVGLKEVGEKYPTNVFDVGIAEEHAVTFSAGLATAGCKPYVAIYSTFLQRAYDQIIHDVAIPCLPVTFLIDRAGLVGADGKTHQGIQDLSYLQSVPNMTIWTPFCQRQLAEMLEQSATFDKPLAIRYPKVLPDMQYNFDGKWIKLTNNNAKIIVLAVGGNMVNNALSAVAKVQKENQISADVVGVTTVKPLDEQYLSTLNNVEIITLEENQLKGGFGSVISTYFASNNTVKVHIMAVNDCFVPHATIQQQLEMCSIDSDSIATKIFDISNQSINKQNTQ